MYTNCEQFYTKVILKNVKKRYYNQSSRVYTSFGIMLEDEI